MWHDKNAHPNAGCRHLKFRYCTCFEDFLDVQATTECRCTLKRVCDMIRTHSQMRLTDKYSKYGPIIWLVWLYSWVFVYELNVIANDVLKMREVIKFQSSGIVIYYKIHFRVLLQSFCAGEVSVVIVTDK